MESDKLPFNPNFDNLEREENAELRFFCEALSLIDAVNNTNLLLGFSSLVNESKDGKIKWNQIPDLFPKDTKSADYISSIERVGDLIVQVVRKGWITQMKTRDLSTIATIAYNFHKNDSKTLLENASQFKPKLKRAGKNLSHAWKEISIKLNDLAKYQDTFMNYHADFQKENYLPHPDSWKLYSGTFVFIFATLLYATLL